MEEGAIEWAVRLYRSPGLARSVRRDALPKGVIDAIRLAAGCRTTCERVSAQTGIDDVGLMRIAALYLLIALFNREGDPYRTLGLASDAPASDIIEHRNWLLKWLHPDVNRNRALSGLSARVLDAAARLLDHPATAAPIAPEPARRARAYRGRWVMLSSGQGVD